MLVLRKKGQTFMELSVLIAVIAAALIGMAVYLKRAYQGRLRATLDTIGEQYAPDNSFSQVETSGRHGVATSIQLDEDGFPWHITTNTYSSNREGYEVLPKYEEEDFFKPK